MDLQKIVVLCVAVVIIGTGIWYVTSSDSKSGITTTDEVSVPTATENARIEDSFSGVGSLRDLIARGDSYTCTYTVTDENGTMEGTSYIDGANARYRMDGTGEWDGQSGTFGTIVDGEFMYWWGDTPEGKMGMKMPATEAEDTASSDTEWETVGTQEPINANQTVAYDCNQWSVDSAVFVPPRDVEFTDMAAMMGGMMQGMPEGFEMPEGFSVPR